MTEEREVVPAVVVHTPEEVADMLRKTPAALATMRHRGTGPRFMKIGRRVLYRPEDVREYLDSHVVGGSK